MHIYSVAKANDLITVSLPSCNEKTYKKIKMKLSKEFFRLSKMVSSIQGAKDIKCGNFCFYSSHHKMPKFNDSEIIYTGEFVSNRWDLSLSKTLSLMKEWPEAKLEILKMHKQNILEFNAKVAEISSLVQKKSVAKCTSGDTWKEY